MKGAQHLGAAVHQVTEPSGRLEALAVEVVGEARADAMVTARLWLSTPEDCRPRSLLGLELQDG
jgi:hypothetical protein